MTATLALKLAFDLAIVTLEGFGVLWLLPRFWAYVTMGTRRLVVPLVPTLLYLGFEITTYSLADLGFLPFGWVRVLNDVLWFAWFAAFVVPQIWRPR